MQPLGQNPEPDPSQPRPLDLSFDQPAPLAPAEQPAKFCPRCGNPVTGSYYATPVHDVLCAACGEAALAAIPPGPGTKGILRALALGSAASFLGMVLYFAVLALTGYEIGYLAVAVGWLVGRAVKKGGYGRGGRKLQWMAVGLTYLSIVGSYMTLGIKELISKQSGAAAASKSDTGQVKANPAGGSVAPATPQAEAKPEPPPGPITFVDFVVAVFTLFGVALALPFLAGFSNILGLFIIALGLFEAWRINRKPPPEVTGPFLLNASA